MFDLEKTIATWRHLLRHNRAFLPEDLDELERHVRDQVETLISAGMPEEVAFRQAIREMGCYGAVEAEYQKVYWGKLKRRQLLFTELGWRLSMLTNYFKIALRSFQRRKGYAFINVAGLTLGLASCLLIFQYVAFEYGFDAFHENADRLYRVTQTTVRNEGEPRISALFGYAVAPALAQEVPEVVRFARFHPDYNDPVIANPAQPDRAFEERRAFYADPAFLQMFSYPLVAGDAAQALAEPGTLLLSESAARKYFGAEDPLGQVLDVTGWISGPFRVNGVFRDIPANSHLQFDVLLPMADLLRKSGYSDPESGWFWQNFVTYVELREDTKVPEVERKFTEVLMRHRGEDFKETHTTAHLNAQPLRDVHLNETIFAGRIVPGSYRTVYFFALIGLVTLLIALVNYVNLATARSLDRAREVGVRKVVGAQRRQLVVQFLFESAITNLAAVTLAVALAFVLRPFVNNLAGVQLTGALWTTPGFWAIFLTAFCAGTLLAGLYPAFVLSSFRPVAVLKGEAGSSSARQWLRQGLVVLQFTASIVLLAGTVIVYTQLDYMRHMDLGIHLEQILTVPGPRALSEGMDRTEARRTLTEELRRIPSVREIATSSSLPGRGFNWYSSGLRQETADPSTGVSGVYTAIDTSFARLYGLTLTAGNGFEGVSAPPPDEEPGIAIANETAVNAVGFDTPAEALDQYVSLAGTTFRIVGVFKDFNWSSAHAPREAALFGFTPAGGYLSLKVGTKDLPQTIADVERIYKTLFPGNPFSYSFVDEAFDEQYRNDQRFATLFTVFAVLAIAIACLGLFGLASFTAQQRTKEIGVRKVLGASVLGLVALFSKDFLKLVAVAVVIASPLAYFTMQRWLDDFAYRIEISWGIFLIAGLTALGVAILTVSYQAIKAALSNPVKSLRYE